MSTLKEKAEAAGLKVEDFREFKPLEPQDRPYLSCMFTFLNRRTGEESAIAYPITRIELFRRMHEGCPDGQPSRIFVIGEDGEWKEQLR
jgi:hypothetical protein